MLLLATFTPLWANGGSEILPSIGMKRIEETVIEKLSDTGEISLGSVAADIVIYLDSSAETVSAILTGHASDPISLKKSGSRNRLSISTDWHNKKTIVTKDLVLEVHLPKDFTGDIDAGSVSGNVELPAGSFGALSLSSTSGNISFKDVKATESSLHTVSGSIEAVNAALGDLEVETTSGKVTLAEIESRDASASSVSGSLSLSGRADTVRAKSISGEVTLSLDAITDSVETESISGDITITLPKGIDVFGSVSSVSGSKDIKLDSVQISGDNRVLEFSTGREDIEIDASSVSGSILIRE